jgi:molybdopterin converting factor small subunit
VTIDVLLFGGAGAAVGADRVRLELREGPGGGARTEEVLARLREQAPKLKPFVDAGRLAVNHKFARPGTTIRPGDEVALIAMVSGG